MSNVLEFDIMDCLPKTLQHHIADVIQEALADEDIDPATIGFHLAAYYTLEGASNCPHCNEEDDDD